MILFTKYNHKDNKKVNNAVEGNSKEKRKTYCYSFKSKEEWLLNCYCDSWESNDSRERNKKKQQRSTEQMPWLGAAILLLSNGSSSKAWPLITIFTNLFSFSSSKRKGEKNNQSCGQKSSFSAWSVKCNLPNWLLIQGYSGEGTGAPWDPWGPPWGTGEGCPRP